MNAKKHAQRARKRQHKRIKDELLEMVRHVDEQARALMKTNSENRRLRRELEDKMPFPIQTLQEMAAGEFAELYAKSIYESGDMRRAVELQNKLVDLPMPKWYDYDPSSVWELDRTQPATIRVHHRIPEMHLVRLVDRETLEYLREQEERKKTNPGYPSLDQGATSGIR